MGRPPLEVADIFRAHGASYRKKHRLSREQGRVMRAIEVCRTAALGGHVDQCDRCGYRSISYNSCRNRHCPKCQSLARAEWLEERQKELLPVEYFHVVFTVPEPIAAIALQNKRIIYNILFRAVSQTLLTIARDRKHLGARIGFTAVLHTWGQNLHHHPHIHCVVPGGGISVNGNKWIYCKNGKFFLPVAVLSRMFRGKFLFYLKRAFSKGLLNFAGSLQELNQSNSLAGYLKICYQTNWVVYCKAPWGGPDHVLKYLSRYTHRIAISNDRLLALRDGKVTFQWKDYKNGNRQRFMTLDVEEFIRRFLLHVLPDRFVRIRHYGFLGNRSKDNLQRCRDLLAVPVPTISEQNWKERYESLTGCSLDVCPSCRQGRLVCIETLIPNHHSLDSS